MKPLLNSAALMAGKTARGFNHVLRQRDGGCFLDRGLGDTSLRHHSVWAGTRAKSPLSRLPPQDTVPAWLVGRFLRKADRASSLGDGMAAGESSARRGVFGHVAAPAGERSVSRMRSSLADFTTVDSDRGDTVPFIH
jgi:hypothetical protein